MPAITNGQGYYGSGGFLSLNVASGSSYVPNYPNPFYTTGLLGWYDSSQPSSIVKDGSNNVSQWNNLFNGATQGATVLPNFTIDPTGTSATYVTGQNYITGQSSGSKSGIYFDGVSSLMSITGLASRMNINDYAIFVVTKNFSTSQLIQVTGSQIALVDKQNNNYEALGLQVGYNQSNNFFLTLAGSQISTGEAAPVTGVAYAFQGVKSSNNNSQSYLFKQDYQNYALNTYQDLNSTATDLPWDQISIGGNISAGDFQQSLIGEILVYNMNALQQGTNKVNVANVLTYLTNKWK